MHRIAYVVSGSFAGAVFTLLLILATRDHASAYASMQDSAGEGMLVTTAGGTQGNINDTLFVIYRRTDARVAEMLGGENADTNRITMAVYRVEPGRFDLVLEDARDITLDLQLPDYMREGSRPLRFSQMRDALRRAQQSDDR